MMHPGPVSHAAFSPDGSLVATGDGGLQRVARAGVARIWDASTGKPVTRALDHEAEVSLVSFSPNGRSLLTVAEDSQARLWSLSTSEGERVREVDVSSKPIVVGTVEVRGSNRYIRPSGFDRKDLDSARSAPARGKAALAAMFSPDGRFFASFGNDQAIRLVSTASGAAVQTPLSFSGRAACIAFSPDSSCLLAAGDDESGRGTILLWELRERLAVSAPPSETGIPKLAAVSRDGRRTAVVDRDGSTWVYDTETGERTSPLIEQSPSTRVVVLGPDGRRLARISEGMLEIFDVENGRVLASAQKQAASLQFSPDGRRLAAMDFTGALWLWDDDRSEPVAVTGSGSGKELRTSSLDFSSTLPPFTFSPDSKQLVAPAQGGEGKGFALKTWDLETKAASTLVAAEFLAWPGIVFGPRADRFAVVLPDQVQVWDLTPGRKGASNVATLKHRDRLAQSRFSPDCSRLATVTAEYTVLVWDLAKGEQISAPMRHRATINRVEFSPGDGRLLITAGDDNTARVWDAATGEAVLPALIHPLPVTDAAFTPDGRRVVTICGLTGSSRGDPHLRSGPGGETPAASWVTSRPPRGIMIKPPGCYRHTRPWAGTGLPSTENTATRASLP